MKIKDRMITLADVMSVLRRFGILLLALAVVGAALGYLYGVYLVPREYEATCQLFVHTADTDLSIGEDSTQVALARALTQNISQTMVNGKLIANVRAYFDARRADPERADEKWEDLSGYKDSELIEMISTTAATTTQQFIQVKAQAPTASLACHLVNAVAAEAEVSATYVVGACRIIPPSTPTTEARRISDKPFSKLIIGCAALPIAAFAVFFLIRVLDPRIRDEKELCDSYGAILPLLGAVAQTENEEVRA